MDAAANIDTEILRHVHEGDVRAAGTRPVSSFADEVFALCRAMVRDGTLAEDLSQDVFSRAFTALPRFRGEASVRTWILRIARNRCVDHLRARGRAPTVDVEPDTQVAPEPSVSDLMSRREDVEAGLSALDESERALVVLRFGHDLGYAELAAAFGIGQGAARMRVSRAVAKMRGAIERPSEFAASRGAAAAPAVGAPAPAAPPPPAAAPPPPPGRHRLGAARRRARAVDSAFARPAPSALRARLLGLAGAL